MTVTVLRFTEVLNCTETGISVFENIYRNERQAATTGQGITGKFVECKKILQEE
jgi:hypothetical protein